MKKGNGKFLTVVLLFVMVIAFVMPSSIPTYGAEGEFESVTSISFNSQLVYDSVVGELEYLGVQIFSQDDQKLKLELVQSSIDALKYICIEDYPNEKTYVDLQGLQYFTNLEELVIEGGTANTGICQNLVIRDLAVIGTLENLKILHIYQVKVANGIEVIADLPNLKVLELEGIRNFDANLLEGKTKLTKLALISCDIEDSDLTIISKLFRLESLELGWHNYEGNNIKDITPLKKLSRLTILNLSNNQIEDISPLAGLTNMAELYLRSNKVRDLSPLSSMVNLTTLDVGGTYYLSERGNPIESLDPLANLPIHTLGANYCGIKDISVFRTFPKSMQKVELDGNSIEDFSVLDKKNIEWLQFRFQDYKMDADSGSTVNLPCSFARLLVEGSVEYNPALKVECNNCKISEDYTKVTINRNVTEASVEVISDSQRSGLSGTTLEINVKDVNAPKLTVSYSEYTPDCNSIRVTIEANEDIQSVAGFIRSNDYRSLYKDYTQNVNETLTIYDMAGNPKDVRIVITQFPEPEQPVIPPDYTGLMELNGVWVYVANGAVQENYSGLIPNEAGWWCVSGGYVDFEYTGLWYDENVGWWYVRNGMIDFTFDGFVPNDAGWWCICGGRVAFEYTGLWCDANVGWWYVENGAINFDFNGFVPNDSGWWCVCGGRVAFEYTGLWYDANVGWWYVENGAINFGYNGTVLHNGESYVVEGGQVKF